MEPHAIIGNVHDLLVTIRRRALEIEQARRLPRDLAAALRDSGVYRLGVPKALGGAEGTPEQLLRAGELVASADGSAGWCTMVGISNNVVAGYMPEAGAREVFADPALPVACSAGPTGRATPSDGGFRVSGRWGFASGITHCEWLWAGCLVMDNGQPRMTAAGPEMVHVCLPVADVDIHDRWHVSGLSGSGSLDFEVGDAFVPEARTFALLDPSRHRHEPLYRMPVMGLFVCQLAAVGIGIARRALDELIDLAQTKVPTMYTALLAEKSVVQVDLARAEAALGAARAFLYDTVRELWDVVSAGRQPSPRQIAAGRLAATHAVVIAARVTRTASTLAGGSAIFDSSALQRHMRDAEAMTHHFSVAPHTWEEAGRVLLGRPPIAPAF